MFMFNYRSDRMREITAVFALPDKPMEVNIPEDLHVTTMSRYNPEWTFPVAFPPASMANVLAETLAAQNASQCHIAGAYSFSALTFAHQQRRKSTPTSLSSSTVASRSSLIRRRDLWFLRQRSQLTTSSPR